MAWFPKLLLFCTLKTILSESLEQLNHPDNKEVNKFLGKVLQADNFEELADRIADKAVKKIHDFQKTSAIKKIGSEDGFYRSQMNPSVKPRIPHSLGHNHKHGKINVDAVLKKDIPLDDLKLRYKVLKNQHASSTPQIEDNNPVKIHLNEEISENGKSNKPISDENFQHPFGNGQTVSWVKKGKKTGNDDSSSDSRDTNGGRGDENDSRKRYQILGTTRTEGDKQFILEDNPDYKEYKEMVSRMEILGDFEKTV
ncbi:uncharacterized protein LOC125239552 [Leguminivora glycinivorella]|uniref:uncharacterized protein LOC125239552 n=1 Tax=Leguminivora glycinivorella TaxID=1035111 RepID=UPI0020104D31|nr:uncharacterized protein LOC125239552 [Leguminivora glycinivorella]